MGMTKVGFMQLGNAEKRGNALGEPGFQYHRLSTLDQCLVELGSFDTHYAYSIDERESRLVVMLILKSEEYMAKGRIARGWERVHRSLEHHISIGSIRNDRNYRKGKQKQSFPDESIIKDLVPHLREPQSSFVKTDRMGHQACASTTMSVK
ncbi:hypothetical protein Tco_0927030 [Tanacetum coccineum]|uniref:Uncharacterized protein n=1 Tax=Tanacetum coccineum TaxID=301880 RepID=A0ABQ5DBJ1_9ASTR